MKRKSCTVIPPRQVAIVPTTRHLPLDGGSGGTMPPR